MSRSLILYEINQSGASEVAQRLEKKVRRGEGTRRSPKVPELVIGGGGVCRLAGQNLSSPVAWKRERERAKVAEV
jgi:hypothetical protein